jgi:hypothetical protein
VDPRFNLTSYDLASPVNQGVMKELLRMAAVMVDADKDGIATVVVTGKVAEGALCRVRIVLP